MVAEAPKSELTTTLHLNLREVSNSPANKLEEIIAGLPEQDREVIAAIQGSNSEKSMVIIEWHVFRQCCDFRTHPQFRR